MNQLNALIVIVSILFIFIYKIGFDYKKLFSKHYFIIIFLGLIARFISCYYIKGVDVDTNYYYGVIDDMLNETNKFEYLSLLNTYILAFVAYVSKFLNYDINSREMYFLIRLPLIILDILTAITIYKIAFRRTSKNNALFASLLYVLNPVLIFMSASWGTYETSFIFFLILAIDCIDDDIYSMSKSIMFFGFTLMAKPNAIIFSPIFAYALFNSFKTNKNINQKEIMYFVTKITFGFLITIGLFYYIMTTFINKSINPHQFLLQKSNFVVANAYNIYLFINKNWATPESLFLGIKFSHINIFFMLIIIGVSFFILIFNKNKSKYFDCATFIAISSFLFMTGNHEKHMFKAIPFLLLIFIYVRKKIFLLLYLLFTCTMIFNIVDVVELLQHNNYQEKIINMQVISVINIILFAVYLVNLNFKQDERFVLNQEYNYIGFNLSEVCIEQSRIFAKPTKKDYIYICIAMLVYGAVAFFRLGDKIAPITGTKIYSDKDFIVELDNDKGVNEILFFSGATLSEKIKVYYSVDRKVWTDSQELEFGRANSWWRYFVSTNKDIKDESKTYKYIKITPVGQSTEFFELAFRDFEGNIISYELDYENSEKLKDEQHIVPLKPSYKNGTIFDESYYSQTVVGMIDKTVVMEWTHPDLGKLLMMIGVKLFGSNPFGWRFIGTLIGVLMIPVMYLFALRLFKSSKWALFSTVLLCSDFMHFVQTRLATIDTYVTFFILIMFYFMYKYFKTNFYFTKLSETLIILFFSGLFFGLGFASKWPAMYGAVGLCILFFYTILKRYLEASKIDSLILEYEELDRCSNLIKDKIDYTELHNIMAKNNYYMTYDDYDNNLNNIYDFIENKKQDINNFFDKSNLPAEKLMPVFIKKALTTCLWCVLFFIIIPTCIYFVTYIPHYNIDHATDPKYMNDNLPQYVVNITKRMYDFHSGLNDTHPYSSEWWKWILDLRPILYYVDRADTEEVNKVASISAFYNPIIAWAGIVAIFYAICEILRRKSQDLLFLFIAYMSLLVPWMAINSARTTYVYHYFPSFLFLILLVTAYFKNVVYKKSYKRVVSYVIVVVCIFIMFYPVLSGLHVPKDYVSYFLRWFDSWWLV